MCICAVNSFFAQNLHTKHFFYTRYSTSLVVTAAHTPSNYLHQFFRALQSARDATSIRGDTRDPAQNFAAFLRCAALQAGWNSGYHLVGSGRGRGLHAYQSPKSQTSHTARQLHKKSGFLFNDHPRG